MTFEEKYKLNEPLLQDEKGRYYLPDHLCIEVLLDDLILVDTPIFGLIHYKVFSNKDGSQYINGDKIARCWGVKTCRLFLSKNLRDKL